MSLADILKTQVKRAIDLLDGINGKGTFNHNVVGSYNSSTDVKTLVTTSITNLTMVKVALSAKEMEATLLTLISCKFLIADLDLLGTVPGKGDTIVFESETWEIVEIKTPPSNPLWILFCKRK